MKNRTRDRSTVSHRQCYNSLRSLLCSLRLLLLGTPAAAVVATVVATASMESTSTHARSRLRGFVDTDDTAVEFLVVHGIHGSVGLNITGEADKPESTAAVGVMILDDDGFFDCSVLRESLAEGLVSGVPGKAADEELSHFY